MVNSDPSPDESLQEEIKALQKQCQDSEARTAGLLKDLHQCQEETIAEQDSRHKLENEVKHLREYLKVLFGVNSFGLNFITKCQKSCQRGLIWKWNAGRGQSGHGQ